MTRANSIPDVQMRLLIFALLLSIEAVQCYRILFTCVPMSGHLNSILVIARALAESGHNCTVAVDDSLPRPKDLSSNIKWISGGKSLIHPQEFNERMMKMTEENGGGMSLTILEQTKQFFQILHQAMVQQLIVNKETSLNPGDWDMVVTDFFTMAGIDLSLYLKVPLTIVATALFLPMADFFHAPIHWWHPSPAIGLWPDGSWFTSVGNIFINSVVRYFLAPQVTKMWLESRTNLTSPWNDLAPLKAYLSGPAPLALISSFQAFEWPLSLPPHIKYIGLLVPTQQLKTTIEPSLKEWLDHANTPIVYFSIRTLAQLNKNGVRMFVETFTSPSFRYHVLWSLRGLTRENLESSSDLMEKITAANGRIRLEKFVPQLAVLNHGNVKVFVTHGGFNSISESIWTGKPMLGIPFGGDQQSNVDSIVRLGVGLQLPHPFSNQLTSSLIHEKLDNILKNNSFAMNCELLSQIAKRYPGAEGSVPIIERTILQGGTRYYQQDDSTERAIVILGLFAFGSLLILGLTVLLVMRCFCTVKKASSKLKEQ